MANKCNYQRKLDETLKNVVAKTAIEDRVPTLLLHSCCGPCSSYVLEYLSEYFSITVYYYNPNISKEEEFEKRYKEQEKIINELPVKNKVSLIKGHFDPSEFADAIKGMENLGERSKRCYACYELRIRSAAETAKANGFDYFTTTLSVSPYKNADWLNEIGGRVSEECGVEYLFSDFKKNNGYKRSIELSSEYGLYRQDYCGCAYSEAEERLRKEQKKQALEK